METPFDDLSAVTKLIELYKQGKSGRELDRYFSVTSGRSIKTLRLHNIPIKSKTGGRRSTLTRDWEFLKERWGTERVIEKKEKVFTQIKSSGKYDYIIFEQINQGKQYSTLLKERGLVVYKNSDSFEKIRNFDLKKWRGINKVDFVLRKKTPR